MFSFSFIHPTVFHTPWQVLFDQKQKRETDKRGKKIYVMVVKKYLVQYIFFSGVSISLIYIIASSQYMFLTLLVWIPLRTVLRVG